MAELAKGPLRSQVPRLEQALTGLVRDHHRQLLAMHLAPSDFLEEQLEALSTETTRGLMTLGPREPPTPTAQGEEPDGNMSAPDTVTSLLPLARAVSVLDMNPGVDQRGAELLVAEWGTDMGRFGAPGRLDRHGPRQ